MKTLFAAAMLVVAIAAPAFAEMPGSGDKTDTKSIGATEQVSPEARNVVIELNQ